MYFVSQEKKRVSAMVLHRHLDISYNAAWRMKQKLMQVMLARDKDKQLSGRIEIDDANLGGERTGCKPRRGADAKTPFLAGVETSEQRQPIRVKLSVLAGFQSTEIQCWSEQHLTEGSLVVSDGLHCFNAVIEAGCWHEKIICGGGWQAVEEPSFYWVNTVLGNVKSALRNTYHAIRPKHASHYLAEYQYRFNRRFDLKSFIPRLGYAAVRTPPMPERLLTLAEKWW